MKEQYSKQIDEREDAIFGQNMNRALSFLWLEITGKCNLTCSHCYADSSPFGELHGDMNVGNWHEVIDEAADLGCREIQFIGGEPTLHPHLMELIEHADDRGFSTIEVFTNATRLKEDLVGFFRRHKVSVATSFYSDDPIVHEQITKGAGSWHRTVAGIQSVLNSAVPLRVGIIEMEQNLGQVTNAKSFLQSIGVTNIRVDYQRGVGRSQTLTSIESAKPVEHYNELCGECWRGKLCVTSTGEVFPCVFSRKTLLGNAKIGLSQILNDMRLLTFRNDVRKMQEQRLSTMQSYDMISQATEVSCIPGDCNPGAWCGPQSCTPSCGPGSGPCSPACGPSTCSPGSGPCWPACAP